MSATVYNWLVVFSDGTTSTYAGETPFYFLDDMYYSDACCIVAIIRNGYNWG